jgi:hypothetical protein
VVSVNPVPYVPDVDVNVSAAWFALATLTAYVVDAALNLPVSVGVNAAVIVADPAPSTVTAPVDELTLATEVFDEEYAMLPPTDAPS